MRRILGKEFLWLDGAPMRYSGKRRAGQTKLDLKLRLLPTPTASQGGDFPKRVKAYLPSGQVSLSMYLRRRCEITGAIGGSKANNIKSLLIAKELLTGMT